MADYSKEQIEALLAGITCDGNWHTDLHIDKHAEADWWVRPPTGHEIFGICRTGGFDAPGAKEDAQFIAASPAIIRQQQARLAKLQAVADAARAIQQRLGQPMSVPKNPPQGWLAGELSVLITEIADTLAAALKALDGES